MKISKATLAVLKNFAGINGNIWFDKGSLVLTKSVANNITAEMTIAETLPSEFGIYDLNEFLGVLGLFTDPDLSFTDKVVTITEGKTKVRYFGADKSILSVPKARMSFDYINAESAVSFKLSSEALAQITKTAAVLKVPNVSFEGKGGVMTATISDLENKSSNSYSMEIDTIDASVNCTAHFRVENLKMIPNDYTVDLSEANVARFANGDLVYHIAIEDDSTFA